MSDHATLLRDVCEHPDDDAPRLAFAAWLKRNGDPERAEFIVKQLKAELLPADDPRRERLQQRLQQLLSRQTNDWFAELPRWARPGGYGLADFRRGFLVRVFCTARQWVKGARALSHVLPVERLFLDNCSGMIADVVQSTSLGNLTELRLWNVGHDPLGADDIRALAPATMPRLTQFGIDSGKTGTAGVAALVRLPFFPQLRELSLSYGALTDAAVGKFAAAPSSGFTSLDLSYNRLGPKGVAALASSPHATSLRRLNLVANKVTAEGMRHLARLSALEHLDLSGGQIGDEGLAALAESPVIQTLRRLRVVGCGIGPVGVEALAAVGPTRLEELDLMDNPVGDRGAIALAGSPVVAQVRILGLTRADIGDEGAVALAKSRHLANLWWLRLGDSRITDLGALALHRSPRLKRVSNLVVTGSAVSAATQKALRERKR